MKSCLESLCEVKRADNNLRLYICGERTEMGMLQYGQRTYAIMPAMRYPELREEVPEPADIQDTSLVDLMSALCQMVLAHQGHERQFIRRTSNVQDECHFDNSCILCRECCAFRCGATFCRRVVH